MGTGKEHRELLLYRLVRLVKALYPNAITRNPYESHQREILRHLDAEERLLFHDLLHSLTLLNGHGRLNGEHERVSTREDYINSLQLLLPPSLQLTPKVLDTYERLQGLYGNKSFSYLEACVKLKVSRSTLKRHLKPLLLHGLVIKHGACGEGDPKSLFQVTETPIKTESNLFDQAHEEWKDYVGFVEF